MFLLANFLNGIAVVLSLILTFYMWIVIARVIVSWISADPRNPIVRAIYNATDPLLFRIRRSIPTVVGGLDFAPLIVIAGIYFLEFFLVQSLQDMAYRLRF